MSQNGIKMSIDKNGLKGELMKTLNTFVSGILLSLAATYSAGCKLPDNSKEIARIDSMRAVNAKYEEERRAFIARNDTLTVIIRNKPASEYRANGHNRCYVGSETTDGKLKQLVFIGDYATGVMQSMLKDGDTLKFIIPKDNFSTNDYFNSVPDSSTGVYDFNGCFPSHLISINGKAFPK
jgi:hypothetical protein